MPVNGGQGQFKRWYHQCFVPSNAESSDDSDTESIIIPNTSTTTNATWDEDILLLPPPPLSPPLPPPPPPPPPGLQTDIPWEDFYPPSPMTLSPTTSPGLFSQGLSPPSPPLRIDIPSEDFFSPITSPGLYSRGGPLPPPPPPPPLFFTSLPPPNSTTTWEEYFPSSPLPPPVLLWDPQEHPKISMVKISELHEKDKVPNCPICMEEFKDDDQASKLPCNHTYCYKCILRWIDNNKTCPVCRLQLDDNFDQQPHQIHVAVSHNDIQNSWNYFLPSSSHVSQNSEGGNSDEGDYESACEEQGDSNANADIVGTSQTGHA